MDHPVRFALVGYGFGGRYFHAPLLSSSGNCEFVGVVTRSTERRALVAAEHPHAVALDDLQAAALAGVEAVAISTPVATHSALTDEALQLGLHVVCDKPFALDAVAAARSVELAAKVGRCLSPYQNRRWDSDFLTLQHLVNQGQLGRVLRFESRFERFKPEPGPSAAGGGALLDFGSHLVDQALVLLGPVQSVYAESTIRESGRDDDLFVALQHEGGARSHLWGSWSQPAPGPRFRVSGTRAAYLQYEPMDCQEPALVAGMTPAMMGEAWGVERETAWGWISRGNERTRVPSLPGAWPSFYEQFANAVRGIGAVPVNPSDAVSTSLVLDAARQSAQSGSIVTI